MNDTKPFDATPSRIARAKREGDVPRSAELSSALALGSSCVALFMSWQIAASAAAANLRDAAHGSLNAPPYLVLIACALGPGTAAPLGAALASTVLAGGITLRQLRFDLTKLNPAEGVRRILSARTVTFAVRALIAAALGCAALFAGVRDAASFGASDSPIQSVASTVIGAVQRVLTSAAEVGLAFGVADALFERVAWRRRLRMSLDEMKRDLRQSEGDPQLRNRRRAQHRALIRGSLARLPDAAFVVANPTHVAIALEYRPPEVAVPRVLLRSIDAGARLVKARARALGIPVIEDVSLARTLLATTRVDDVIPRACYLAVARIVAVLLRAKAD